MSTETLTLTDFLLARIAEDEAAFEYGCPGSGEYSKCSEMSDRLMADVEAKRRIVELHRDGEESRWEGDDDPLPAYCTTCHDRSRHEQASWPCATLKALALPYADHPDYRDEWRP